MKTLIIMRHASAPNTTGIDMDRSLSDKGVAEVEQTLQFLKKYSIDKVLCSSALRTVETFNIIQEELKINLVNIMPELYRATEVELVEHIVQQRNFIESVLLIGHNPSVSNLVALLTENGEWEDDFTGNLAPAQAVVLTFPAESWSELSFSTVTLKKVFIPNV